jgi:hypothetical protein
MKSPTEEFCKSQFTAFLTSATSYSSVTWDDGDEPPDFYLTSDSVRYAVEVTALMESIPVGAITLPEQAIINALWGLVDDVAATAQAQHWLTGSYIVAFLQPIVDFRSVRNQIEQELLTYIRNTQHLDRAPEYLALDRGPQSVRIQKIHNQQDQIHKVGPSRGKSEGEAGLQICTLLGERLHDKDHKLRNIFLPKILLLYDSYRFATPAQCRDCVPNLSDRAGFHTIFIVRGTDDFILHTMNPQWSI